MTLTQFFENEKNKSFHMEDCFYKQIIYGSDIPQLILESSILDRYDSILRDLKVKLTMNDLQIQNYKYNPKKIASELYGSSEYWFLILHANELFSASQLNLEKGFIYLYKDGVQSVINEIMNVDRDYIQKNASEISEIKTNIQ